MDSDQYVVLLPFFLKVCLSLSILKHFMGVISDINNVCVSVCVYMSICLSVCLYTQMYVYACTLSFNLSKTSARLSGPEILSLCVPGQFCPPCSSSPGHPAACLVCCRQKAEILFPIWKQGLKFQRR